MARRNDGEPLLWRNRSQRGGSGRHGEAGVSESSRATRLGQADVVSELDESVDVSVTRREALELCAGLRAYVRSMEEHAAGDPSGSHPDFGQLFWSLDDASMSHGQVIELSDDAVSPELSVDWP